MADSCRRFDHDKPIRLNNDDWSAHDCTDFEWAEGTDAIAFGDAHGPAIIVGTRDYEYNTFDGTKTGKQIVFMVLRPDEWEEYGMPMVEYEPAAICNTAPAALGELAKMVVENDCANWHEMDGLHAEWSEDI